MVVRDPATGAQAVRARKGATAAAALLPLAGGRRFVPLEQVIAAHLDRLFPGMKIVAHHAFRVTRDADVEVEVDEADDLLATLESLLRARSRRRRPSGSRSRARCRSDCARCCCASWSSTLPTST